MPDLNGKVALITGASRGIGASAARAFVAAGAQVALIARNADAIGDLTAELGTAAIAIPCDVSRFWELESAVAATIEAFGRLDILVNNAGVIDPVVSMAASDPEDWSKVIDINLKGVYYGMRAVLPEILAQGGGTILTVSSGAASNALDGWSHYCTSKAGARMLTLCAHKENQDGGIRAIGLSPGTVATEMQRVIKGSGINPVSQLDWSEHIPPEWPAAALVWLCTAEADDLIGTEVSLRDSAIRARIGLVPERGA